MVDLVDRQPPPQDLSPLLCEPVRVGRPVEIVALPGMGGQAKTSSRRSPQWCTQADWCHARARETWANPTFKIIGAPHMISIGS